MIYKQGSEDILGDLFRSIAFPVSISSVVSPASGKYTIETCDMYHASPGFKVTIGGKEYTIEDIIPGTHPNCGTATKDQLKVKGSANISVDSFDMFPAHFFHSTPIAQGLEMAQKKIETDKVPMAWLYEQFTDTFKEDPMSNDEREIKFKMFFLTHSNPEKWMTEEAYKKGVKPMRRLAELFIEKIKSMPWRFDADAMEYDINNYAKFGVFIANKGMEESVWHDKVCGCELSMTLKVYKLDVCDECES